MAVAHAQTVPFTRNGASRYQRNIVRRQRPELRVGNQERHGAVERALRYQGVAVHQGQDRPARRVALREQGQAALHCVPFAFVGLLQWDQPDLAQMPESVQYLKIDRVRDAGNDRRGTTVALKVANERAVDRCVGLGSHVIAQHHDIDVGGVRPCRQRASDTRKHRKLISGSAPQIDCGPCITPGRDRPQGDQRRIGREIGHARHHDDCAEQRECADEQDPPREIRYRGRTQPIIGHAHSEACKAYSPDKRRGSGFERIATSAGVPISDASMSSGREIVACAICWSAVEEVVLRMSGKRPTRLVC